MGYFYSNYTATQIGAFVTSDCVGGCFFAGVRMATMEGAYYSSGVDLSLQIF